MEAAVVTDLPAHTRERIDDIRAFHVATRRTWWHRLARKPVQCVMCGVPIGRCEQLKWAAAVAAGRRPAAGWAP
jgi:hypothetical protein